MKYSSIDVGFFLVDGYDLRGDLTTISDAIDAQIEDTRPLGSAWPRKTPVGIFDATLTQEGYFDDATGAVHDALSEQQGTSRIVCMGLEGNTIGKRFRGYTGAFGSKYSRVSSGGQIHKANAEYQINGQIDDNGIILQPLAAKTADWNTEGAESQDAGASSAAGGVGYLQVTAFSGFTGFVAKIRHSADDVTYADLVTFTNVTSGPTAQRVAVAGTVNRHLAVDGNVTGTGSVTCLIGFKRL